MVEGTSPIPANPQALSSRPAAIGLGLAALLALLMLGAAMVGAYPISLGEMIAAVGRKLAGAAPQGQIDTVLFEVRLPRVLSAVFVGASIAAAGAAYQTLFRNPLVSPDILGVSTGAGLGAVLGIFLSLPVFGIQLTAFVMGLATVGLVYGIASVVHGREPILVLVLAGVVVGSLAGAAISLMKIMADPYDQLPAIVFWMLGSLSAIPKGEVWAAAPLVVLGLVPLVLLRWRINVLSLGDEEVKALGVEAGRLRLLPAQAGEVHLEGARMAHMKRGEIARRVAYVPQAHAVHFPFRVLDMVVMGRTAHLGLFAAPGEQDRRKALAALAALGIADLAENEYTRISGGQRQLALVARALAQDAPAIVMDEPTASLDFGNQVVVLAEVKRLARRGLAVVLSTHDPDHAFSVGDRVALLDGGRLIAQGSPADVLTPERLRAVYGVSVIVERLSQGQTVCAPDYGTRRPLMS